MKSYQNNLDSLLIFIEKHNLLNKENNFNIKNKLENTKGNYLEFLIKNNYLKSKDFFLKVKDNFNIPQFDILSYDKKNLPDFYKKIESHIKKYGVFPIIKSNEVIIFAITNIFDKDILKEIELEFNIKTEIILVDFEDLLSFINDIFLTNTIKNFTQIDNLSNINFEVVIEDNNKYIEKSLLETDDPIVSFINKIIIESIYKKASDIHFECFETFYRIRQRVDGILQEIANIDIKLAPQIISRLKVISNLDITEKRRPQDGRFKIRLDNNNIDFRVNSCPTLFFEKMVLRILNGKNIDISINNLGLSKSQKDIFLSKLRKTQGMILITGPTGSGKTVTLYSGISFLNNLELNISTAENPIEISLPGINQLQINNSIGLTFSEALKTFLRQDPDIIMLGEIRDLETANIAIKATQTGHLFLSTLHTNSAIETINRLLYMGVESYKLASSLELIIAQRLIRILCKYCKTKVNFEKNDFSYKYLERIGFLKNDIENILNNKVSIYKANSCNKCHKGFKNRTGIFEVLEINEDIKRMILEKNSFLKINDYTLNKLNIITLRKSAINLILKGETSLEETLRVTNY